MQDLPAGPYISKLRTLVLKQNFFIEIPKSLAGAAPRLRRLDMSHNLLRPSEIDIDTVLQLPSLQNLGVTKVGPFWSSLQCVGRDQTLSCFSDPFSDLNVIELLIMQAQG